MTQDVIRRPDGSRRPLNPPYPAHPAAVQPRQPLPAVSPRILPAVQPGDDSEATIIIGRHRLSDAPSARPSRTVRGGWIGRAVVRVLRRGAR